jgi:hypothetical protein
MEINIMSKTKEELLAEFKIRRDNGEFSGPFWKSQEQKQAWYDQWKKDYNSLAGLDFRTSQPHEINRPRLRF